LNQKTKNNKWMQTAGVEAYERMMEGKRMASRGRQLAIGQRKWY